MTRILCLADTQIGVGTVTLADQHLVLDRIIGLALAEKVDLVIHGGDVFEGPIVTPAQVRLFLDATAPLRRAHIPMMILRGNGRHDMAVQPVHALDVLREIPGFYVFDRPDTFQIDGCSISALPWVHPGRVLATLNGSLDHDRINAQISEVLVGIAGQLYGGAEQPSMLIAHWAISSAKLPSGLSVEEMREPVLPWADLDAIGYDLIVGAHIHEPQVISNYELDQGPGFVIGSPQPLNFGETGERGCWLVELGSVTSYQFKAIESRPFITLDVAPDEPLPAVPEGAIVRVRASMTERQLWDFDQQALRRDLLASGAAQVRLELSVEREARRRVDVSEQLSPVEAMTLYCDANGITDPLRGALIDTIAAWASE